MTTTVRISDDTHARLVALSSATGRRMHSIIEDAIAAYESDRFWDGFTAGYAELADDPVEWAHVHRERAGEEPALRDDLDPDT